MNALAIPPADVVFVDDKAKNAAAAKVQGIQGVQFFDAEQLKHDLTLLGITWSER